MTAFFLHGVPDTPAMWRPLIATLELGPEAALTPALPGFVTPAPRGFSCSKEAYLDWLIGELEAAQAEHGPLDVVGHDWGAVLLQRAAVLRPDLVRSWAVANAVLEPGYQWHLTARIWQTPILGELAMAAARPSALRKMLRRAGMPAAVLEDEIAGAGPGMKRAILKLYRSAKDPAEWARDLGELSDRGLVIWGERDPFVPIRHARRFCDARGVALFELAGAGHWAICQRPEEIAARLRRHWAGTGT